MFDFDVIRKNSDLNHLNFHRLLHDFRNFSVVRFSLRPIFLRALYASTTPLTEVGFLFRYKIKVGDSVRTIEEASERVYFATKIIMHPKYHDEYKENDIALVKLSFRVTLTRNVRKVCLPQAENSTSYHENATPGAHGFVAGWGATQVLNPGETADSKYSSSAVLRSAQFQIQDSKLCQNSTDYHFNDSLEFCAGSDRNGIGPCTGDSGGPFVMRVLKGGAWKWVTVGLVSWGEGCGIYGRYTFYTKLAPYVDWINQHVRK